MLSGLVWTWEEEGVKTGGVPAGQKPGRLYNQGVIWIHLRSCQSQSHRSQTGERGLDGGAAACSHTHTQEMFQLSRKPCAMASWSGW